MTFFNSELLFNHIGFAADWMPDRDLTPVVAGDYCDGALFSMDAAGLFVSLRIRDENATSHDCDQRQ
ncbi:MAG: hypothetical protein ACKVK8_07530 [Rhodospirillales bacterium]